MTDPVVAAGAHTAGEILKRANEASKSNTKAIREAAAENGALDHAATIYGKRMAVREGVILRILQPIARLAGFSADYFRDTFQAEISERLDGIPDEGLKPPVASIAAPAMQALGFSLDEPSLKDMYLNLLANASTVAFSDEVHPSFVETVKQLSADEARVLDFVLQSDQLPVARLKHNMPQGGYRLLRSHLLRLFDSGVPLVDPRLEGWVENWDRLGLVDVDYALHVVIGADSDTPYEWVNEWPPKVEAEASLPLVPEGEVSQSITFDKGVLRPTARGRDFFRAVGGPPSKRFSEQIGN